MADQQNLNQVRIIDPINTTIAQGYADPEFVGSFLFPRVPVAISGGQILEFDKSSFQRYNTSRAPGTPFKRMEMGYLGKPYALLNKGLEAIVPREHQRDASVMPGINLSSIKIKGVMQVLTRELEIEQATLAITAANYDSGHKIALSGTSKFSDPASDPIAAIDGYKEAIRSTTGMYPNTIVFSAVAWVAFKQNPAVRSRIQYTQKAVITEDIAAGLLGIAVVKVGASLVADAAGTFSDVWSNNIVLAYTNLGSLDAAMPSYGYTYTMNGHPAVEQPYWDNGSKGWVYGVGFERAPVLSGITAGFLIQTPA